MGGEGAESGSLQVRGVQIRWIWFRTPASSEHENLQNMVSDGF